MVGGKRTPLVFAIGIAVTLTACSSASGGSAKTTSAPAAASSSASGANVAAATTAVQAVLDTPTKLPTTTPLSRKPDAGKKLVILQNSAGPGLVVAQASAAAAKLLGWTVTPITVGTTAEAPGQALDSAISLKPDMIQFSGHTADSLATQLARAKSLGIPVLLSGTDDATKVDGTLIDAGGLDGVPQTTAWGKMTADYSVSKSGATTKALVVNLPQYAILTAFTNGYQKELTTLCPNCGATVLNAQAADLTGGVLVSNIISALQRDPKINWVILTLGNMTVGLSAALSAAGLQDKVQVGGESATQANLTAVKGGTEQMWTGFPAAIYGWQQVDIEARYFNGDPLDSSLNPLLPTQLLTSTNIANAPVDSTGYYIGVTDYAAQYQKLWHLS